MLKNLFRLSMGAVALSAVAVMAANPASAQEWKKEWDRLVANAKGKSLKINYQGNKGYDGAIKAFENKFGVKVSVTASRTSQALPRIRTEQQNGRFDWDLWWGPTSNMSNVAAPAGLLTPMEPFLFLPEVTDPSKWAHTDYIWGDPKKQVFLHVNEITYGGYVNMTKFGDYKGSVVDAMIDPNFKGGVAMREASRPNAGAFAVADVLNLKGEAFLRKLLKDSNPQIYRSPQQVNTTVMRGGHAIALGVQTAGLAKCYQSGGCKDVKPIESLVHVLPRGIALFKNPPNADVAKLFLNWMLSKEGQEVLINAWAEHNVSGAHSMRTDVKAVKGHEDTVPDFSNPKQYVYVGAYQGFPSVKKGVAIFREIKGGGKRKKK